MSDQPTPERDRTQPEPNLNELLTAEGEKIIERAMQRYLYDPQFHATVYAASGGAIENYMAYGNEEMKLVAATCKHDPGIIAVIRFAAAIAAQIVRPDA